MRDTMIAAAVGIGTLLAVGGSALVMRNGGLGGATPAASEDRPSPADHHASAPPPRVVEDCNRYAATRDNSRVVKDGAVGGVLGAGAGAATGAIVGHHNVGKGAAIGALVGAAAGALYGINEENKKTEEARAAYSACMARNGYQ